MRALLPAALLLVTIAVVVLVLASDPALAPAAGDPTAAPVKDAGAVQAGAAPVIATDSPAGDPGQRVAAEGALESTILWTDGTAAAGAVLSCTPRRRGTVPRKSVQAGASGRVRLTGLASGSHRLRVTHRQAIDNLVTEVRIEPGRTSELGTLRLHRGLALAGRVELVAGGERRPAPRGWTVRAFPTAGASHLTRIGEGGAFRFEGLPGGIYEVLLWHRSWRASPPVRAFSGQQGVLVTVHRGQARFAGSVTHPDGRPLQVFEVEVLDEGSLRPYARTSRSWGQGHYRTRPLPPGAYRLRFLAGGHRPRDLTAVLPESGEVRLDVVLPEQRAVRGLVLDAGGRPLPGAQVMVLGRPARYPAMDRLGFGRMFEGIPGYRPGVFGNTDAEGRFSLPPQTGASLLLVRDMDHAPDLVEVPPGGRDLVVKMVRGVEVRGRLVDQDGRGRSGVPVLLLPAGSLLDPRHQQEKTDGAGRFAFHPVGPGTWSLLVLRGGAGQFERTFDVGSEDVDLGELR